MDIIIPHNPDYALVAASRVLRKSSKGEYDALFGSPEDVILNKLIYYQLGGGVGEKHLRDIAGILKLQKENLGLKYLDEWAARLGVSAEWSLVQKHVGNKGI